MNTVTLKTAVLTAPVAVVALMAALLVTVPAFATARDGSESQRVRYGDLDLATQHGAQQLYTRLSHAARDVCTHHGDPLWLAQRNGACYHDAVGRAVTEVGSPNLTAEYHRHMTGSAQRVSADSRGTNLRVG